MTGSNLDLTSMYNRLAIVAHNYNKYHEESNKADCQIAFARILKAIETMPESQVKKIINDLEIIMEETFIAGQEEVLD